MKRFALLAFGATLATTALGQQIQVFVDGREVPFRGRGPVMVEDRVLVPLRGVLQALGAEVEWDPSTQTVTAHKTGLDIRLGIGETTASVNGQPVELDVPAQLIDGSTMIPVRFVSEELGEVVKWDTRTETVYIHANFDNAEDQTPPAPTPVAPPPPPPPPEAVERTLPRGLVLAVHMRSLVSSDLNVAGDRIEAVVDRDLPGIPAGSVVKGHVVLARPHTYGRAGILEVRFNRLVTPDGVNYRISGSGFGLDGRSVIREDGLPVARPELIDQETVFAGLGEGTGRFVGIRADGPPTYPYYHTYGHHPSYRAALLRPSTEFGVRLDDELEIQVAPGPQPPDEPGPGNG